MMRIEHMALLATLGLLAACGSGQEPGKASTETAAAAPEDMPKLRAGLWRISLAGAPAAMADSSICMDETIQEQMSLLAGPPSPDCPAGTFTPRPGGGYSVRSVCDRGEAGTTVSEGVITGDFDTAYRTEMTVTTTGAASEMMNSTMTMVSTSTFAGACPTGMKPGDFDVAGQRMNLIDLAEQSQAAQAAAGTP